MNPGEALVKLQDISNFKEKTFVNNVIKFAIERYKTKEVINRTLFISERTESLKEMPRLYILM